MKKYAAKLLLRLCVSSGFAQAAEQEVRCGRHVAKGVPARHATERKMNLRAGH